MKRQHFPFILTLLMFFTLLGCQTESEEGFMLTQQEENNVIDDSDVIDLSEGNEQDIEATTCSQGKKLSLWLDLDRDGVIGPGDAYRGTIVAYKGKYSAKTNYNYYSVSAHPIIGPTPKGYESHVFFYEGPDGLALNFYHNIDNGGSADNIVKWDIYTMGNNRADKIILSDDKGEIKTVYSDYQSQSKKYATRFHYWYNTDGGVIGPFNGDDFTIRFSVLRGGNGDNINGSFYSADGKVLSLIDQNEISSFIISFAGVEECH